jgi:hypothetical protein
MDWVTFSICRNFLILTYIEPGLAKTESEVLFDLIFYEACHFLSAH